MGNKNRFYIDVMAMHKEVTGSCILNVIKFPDGTTKKVLIDCGLFQEPDYLELNKTLPFNAENLDYVIVTHNHVDHVGRLPLLVKNGYRGKIYTSMDTSILIRHALADSYKVIRQKAKLSNEKSLYSEEDVEQTISQIRGISFEKSIKLDDNIKVTMFMNGHLQGAAIILLQISFHDHYERKPYENINLLFTGDYKNDNMFFDVNPLPKWVHQLPITIIQESTYGDMDSSEIQHVFKDNILNAVSSKSEIVVPVFSLGRSQEIMFTLKKWQDEGELDVNVPIYFDGKLGMRYTSLYLSGNLGVKEECSEFLPENFTYVSNPVLRARLLTDGKPKIILTTSGMGSYGPAQTYLPAFLTKKNALIHFTGYCAENTLGRRLYDCEYGDAVEVGGLVVKKLAKVEFTSEYSAHAKSDELLNFLKDFESINTILINHGSLEAADQYSSAVIKNIDSKNVGILGRDYLFRLNGYGLIKTIPTKFGPYR